VLVPVGGQQDEVEGLGVQYLEVDLVGGGGAGQQFEVV
jgi:hypothetical protein